MVFVKSEALPALGYQTAPAASEEEPPTGNGGNGNGAEEGESTNPKRERVLPKESGGGAMEAKLRNRKAKKVTEANSTKMKEDLMLGKGLAGTKIGQNTEGEEEDRAAAAAAAATDGDESEVARAAEEAAAASQKSLRELIERRPAKLKKEDEERLAMHGMRGVPVRSR